VFLHGQDPERTFVERNDGSQFLLRDERRPIKVAAVALANKIARMAWAMMVRGEQFKEPRLLPAA
jgi:hypothetical protein